MDKETQVQSSNELVQPKTAEEFLKVVKTFMADHSVPDEDIVIATLWLKMKVDSVFKVLTNSLPPQLAEGLGDLTRGMN